MCVCVCVCVCGGGGGGGGRCQSSRKTENSQWGKRGTSVFSENSITSTSYYRIQSNYRTVCLRFSKLLVKLQVKYVSTYLF